MTASTTSPPRGLRTDLEVYDPRLLGTADLFEEEIGNLAAQGPADLSSFEMLGIASAAFMGGASPATPNWVGGVGLKASDQLLHRREP